jgi:hypothetical protein
MRIFGHQRAVRNDAGEIIGSQPSPVRAKTQEILDSGYGPDNDKRLVVSLEACDLICIRPERTSRIVRIGAKDLYAQLLRAEANKAAINQALAKRAKRQERLAAQRQRRAEKRLVERRCE